MQKSRALGRPSDDILYGGAKYMWLICMELASCQQLSLYIWLNVLYDSV